MRKFCVLMVVTLMVFFAGVSSAFASTTILIPSSDRAAFEKVHSELTKTNNNKLSLELKPGKTFENNGTSSDLFTYSKVDGKIVFNDYNFAQATAKSQKATVGEFVKALQDSGVSSQSQQKVVSEMGAVNDDVNRLLVPLMLDSTQADIFTAMGIVNPIMPSVRVIIGIVALLVAIALVFFTAVDLFFIGLPIGRSMIESTGENGNKKPMLVSWDAVSVIRETESSLDSSGGYKNAYGVYFKRRVVTYIILSFCLIVLVAGEMGQVIAWIMNLGSGLFGRD